MFTPLAKLFAKLNLVHISLFVGTSCLNYNIGTVEPILASSKNAFTLFHLFTERLSIRNKFNLFFCKTFFIFLITPLRNNNASISAIKLQSGALAIIYNDVSFNEDGSRTVWPDQRCPVAMAISEDGGKTWPWRRIVEHGEGFIGPWNDVNNRRYEYPVMMQSKDGKIHAAYAWGRRVRIKYVCVDEAWIRGAKVCKGAEDNPEMPCNR